jgi:hypothetical protein
VEHGASQGMAVGNCARPGEEDHGGHSSRRVTRLFVCPRKYPPLSGGVPSVRTAGGAQTRVDLGAFARPAWAGALGLTVSFALR